jgi:hypothetical protein
MEHTRPGGWITSVGGRPIPRRNPTTAPPVAAARPAPQPRGLIVRGVLLPYDTIVDDGRHRDWFSFGATEWDLEPWTPLKLEHRTMIGMARIYETAAGLLVEGHIGPTARPHIAGRDWLSAGITSIERRTRRGVTEHLRCRLTDVSLTDRPIAKGHTRAFFAAA